MYDMTTTRGNRYVLDDEGYVLARSDGPRGWDYARGWRITGIAKRWHSAVSVKLAAIVAGADRGQGWIRDWDHGTYRAWGGERMRSLTHVPDESREAHWLRRVFAVPSHA